MATSWASPTCRQASCMGCCIYESSVQHSNILFSQSTSAQFSYYSCCISGLPGLNQSLISCYLLLHFRNITIQNHLVIFFFPLLYSSIMRIIHFKVDSSLESLHLWSPPLPSPPCLAILPRLDLNCLADSILLTLLPHDQNYVDTAPLLSSL